VTIISKILSVETSISSIAAVFSLDAVWYQIMTGASCSLSLIGLPRFFIGCRLRNTIAHEIFDQSQTSERIFASEWQAFCRLRLPLLVFFAFAQRLTLCLSRLGTVQGRGRVFSSLWLWP
jgi:hypothetical protein